MKKLTPYEKKEKARKTIVPFDKEGDLVSLNFSDKKEITEMKSLSSLQEWTLSSVEMAEFSAYWAYAAHFRKRVKERGKDKTEKQVFASFLVSSRLRRRLANLLIKQASGNLLVEKEDGQKLVLYIDGKEQVVFCRTLLTAEMTYWSGRYNLGIVKE